mgnify:CR=1 FL=1
MRRGVSTGMGAITPVGLSVEEFWNSVKEGKTNFAEVTRFDSTNYRAHMAAEINNFNPKDYMDFKSAKRMELFSQYAVAAAKARDVDVLLCDTAGRLHNKKNLMEELRKIYRVLEREYPDAYLETLVVLDGTTGQNALAQARQFKEVANVTGIILTKLDGTAKGGIAVAIQSELDIPVKYIGVGESIDDLQKFNAEQVVNALFDVKTEEEES